MKTNKVYAIYWVPSGYTVSPSYQPLIDGFFKNVAAANGQTTNVYSTESQYYDTLGWLTYSSSFGASAVDTNAFPANSCYDPYTAVCLSDTQVRSEVQKIMSAKGWRASPTTLFFMFTPRNVGSCIGSACSFVNFCGYHSWYGSGTSVLLYANMPYSSWVPAACDAGQHPNGDDADAMLNVASHEHREAITDPQGNAWYDASGYESSDKCEWTFGTPSGSEGAEYNQTINGVNYYLQQEWSNDGAACVLGYVKPPVAAPTISSFSPASGLAGDAVTITGTNFAGVTSITIGSIGFTTANIDSRTQLTATIPSSALTGKLTVKNLAGYSTTLTYYGVLPRIDSLSPASGSVGSIFYVNGNTLKGTTKVIVGGVAARYSVVSNILLKVYVPTGAVTGPVAVTNAGGTTTSATSFTVL
jgi:hypothetical protein